MMFLILLNLRGRDLVAFCIPEPAFYKSLFPTLNTMRGVFTTVQNFISKPNSHSQKVICTNTLFTSSTVVVRSALHSMQPWGISALSVIPQRRLQSRDERERDFVVQDLKPHHWGIGFRVTVSPNPLMYSAIMEVVDTSDNT